MLNSSRKLVMAIASAIVTMTAVQTAPAHAKDNYPGQEAAYYACREECLKNPKTMLLCTSLCGKVFSPTGPDRIGKSTR
jgi:hypothetical protein